MVGLLPTTKFLFHLNICVCMIDIIYEISRWFNNGGIEESLIKS
jgi:hypothetical protein